MKKIVFLSALSALLAACGAFEQEFEGDGCLARAGASFQEIDVTRHQSAREYIIQSRDADEGPDAFTVLSRQTYLQSSKHQNNQRTT